VSTRVDLPRSAILASMREERLPGGNAGGAVLVDGTVRRPAGPWTPAVHSLLRHLDARGFEGSPRVLGTDEQGREVLTFIPGTTIGLDRPWPAWVHSDDALVQVGAWLRNYHDAVSDFVPPSDARWRTGLRAWQPGDVVGHNDAAPYNAVWTTEPVDPTDGGHAVELAPCSRLVGFVDWDFAAPCPALRDLAFVVFSWIPLHARNVVAAEGFTRFDERPRRLHLLLDAYGYRGGVDEVLRAVRERIVEHATGLQELADAGDPLFARIVSNGVIDNLHRALAELADDAPRFSPPSD
jgi:hypothetical protein